MRRLALPFIISTLLHYRHRDVFGAIDPFTTFRLGPFWEETLMVSFLTESFG